MMTRSKTVVRRANERKPIEKQTRAESAQELRATPESSTGEKSKTEKVAQDSSSTARTSSPKVSTSKLYKVSDLPKLELEFEEREVLQPGAIDALKSAIVEAKKVHEPIRVKGNKVVDGQHRLHALEQILDELKSSDSRIAAVKQTLNDEISDEEQVRYSEYLDKFEKQALPGKALTAQQWLSEQRKDGVQEKVEQIKERSKNLSQVTFRFEEIEDDARVAAIRLGNVKSKLFIDQIRAVHLAVRSGSSLREVARQLEGQLGSLRSAERRVEVVGALGELTPFVVDKIQTAIEKVQEDRSLETDDEIAMWKEMEKESRLRPFLAQLKKAHKNSKAKRSAGSLNLSQEQFSTELKNWFLEQRVSEKSVSSKSTKSKAIPAKEFMASVEQVPGLSRKQIELIGELYSRAVQGKSQS